MKKKQINQLIRGCDGGKGGGKNNYTPIKNRGLSYTVDYIFYWTNLTSLTEYFEINLT